VEAGVDITTIVSEAVHNTDTRFGKAADWCRQFEEITGKPLITSIVEAERIGPGKLFDVLVVAPCTGNTMAKLTNGITDTQALMAIKAHLRNLRPVVIAIATNDGLGFNARNIADILNAKYVYMVPFGQDNPVSKPNSLVAHLELVPETVSAALDGKQIQPVLVDYRDAT
jgi:dipicolinate synthase subunit B